MTSSNLKFASLEQDRMNMSRKMFQQSGFISMSPKGKTDYSGTPLRTGSRGTRQDLVATIDRFHQTAHK